MWPQKLLLEISVAIFRVWFREIAALEPQVHVSSQTGHKLSSPKETSDLSTATVFSGPFSREAAFLKQLLGVEFRARFRREGMGDESDMLGGGIWSTEVEPRSVDVEMILEEMSLSSPAMVEPGTDWRRVMGRKRHRLTINANSERLRRNAMTC